MTETLTHEYSSESARQELSNENQHDRVLMAFKILGILIMLWTKVVIEGLTHSCRGLCGPMILLKISLEIFLNKKIFEGKLLVSFRSTVTLQIFLENCIR